MIIKEIRIKGSKVVGTPVRIILKPNYNAIECDEWSLNIISKGLACIFHPETALQEKIFNKKEFDKDGFVEILVENRPKKLVGFPDATSLKIVRKINQRRITVIDDDTDHHFSIQNFLDCLAASGISIPTVFTSHVEHVVNWINTEVIKSWTAENFSSLWQRVYIDILCNDRYGQLQEWMMKTRQIVAKNERQTRDDLQKVCEKIQDYKENVAKYDEFSRLYKQMRILKEIVQSSLAEKQLEERKMLEMQKKSIEKEILALKKEEMTLNLMENRKDQLIDARFDLEQTLEKFQILYFDEIPAVEHSMTYQIFLKNFLLQISNFQETFKDYSDAIEKCIDAEINILQYHLLLENEESKITAQNLASGNDNCSFETFKKSFQKVLDVMETSLQQVREYSMHSNMELDVFMSSEDDPNMIKDRCKNVLKVIESAQNDMKDITIELSACFQNVLPLNAEKRKLEQNIDDAKYFLAANIDVPFAYIEGLANFEELLEEMPETDPLHSNFLHFPVRECQWKDFVYTLEAIEILLMVVVTDTNFADEFLCRLPSEVTVKIIAFEEFQTRIKEDLPILRRARYPEVTMFYELIESSSINTLIKDFYKEMILASAETEIEVRALKRTIFKDDDTFESPSGVLGGGFNSISINEIQQKILKYLDNLKLLRAVKAKIKQNDLKISELMENVSTGIHEIYCRMAMNPKSFENLLDLTEEDFKCLCNQNIAETKVAAMKELITWLNRESWRETLEDSYIRKMELKEQIKSLDVEYENLLHEKTEIYQKLNRNVYDLREFGDELMFKYTCGQQTLVDIDKIYIEIVRDSMEILTNNVEQCEFQLKSEILKVQEQYDVKNARENFPNAVLMEKQNELAHFIAQISSINENLKTFQPSDAVTNRSKVPLLREFPTYESQFAEMNRLQMEIQENYPEYMTPNQTKPLALKTDIHKCEKYVNSVSNWPTGILESIFVMQTKITGHAISNIMNYARTLALVILPDGVLLKIWLQLDETPGNEIEIKDFSDVRELRFAIYDPISPRKIHITKEMVMLLLIHSICATFQAPFVVLDNIFQFFGRQWCPMVSEVLKILGMKQQIIVIKGQKDVEDFGNAVPDNRVDVRVLWIPMPNDEKVEDEEVDEQELYKTLTKSLQTFHF